MFRAGGNISLGAASQSFLIFSTDGFRLCIFVEDKAIPFTHCWHKKMNIETGSCKCRAELIAIAAAETAHSRYTDY